MVSSLFLIAFIASETFRAVLTFAAQDNGVKLLSLGIIALIPNACAAGIALVALLLHSYQHHGLVSPKRLLACIDSVATIRPDGSRLRAYQLLITPSLFHVASIIFYEVGLGFISPYLLDHVIVAKIPITVVLHHFLFQRQRDLGAWLSFVVLVAGILILYVPAGVSWWVRQVLGEAVHDSKDALGCVIGLGIAMLSSLGILSTERLVKQPVSFWVTQFWLGLFGTISAGFVSVLLGAVFQNPTPDYLSSIHSPLSTEPSARSSIATHTAIIVATTVASVQGAIILGRDDSVGQSIALSVSVVTSMVAQWMLFSAYRAHTMTWITALGTSVVIISSWTYYYRKQAHFSSPYVALVAFPSVDSNSSSHVLDLELEVGQGRMHGHEHGLKPSFTPTRRRLCLAIALGAGFTCLPLIPWTAVKHGHTGSTNTYFQDAPRPADDPGNFDKQDDKTQPKHPSLLDPSATRTAIDDFTRFFAPHNITATAWGHISGRPNCITEWVEQEQVYPVSTKFTDWEYSFLGSGCPVYPIPNGGLIFHQYWSGAWRPFNALSIAAWLATQRLGDGHRMVYWYENGEPPREVRERFNPYADHVEFRELNRTEAEGTCVADMPEWTSAAYREANQMAVETLSDITRSLLLAKYGGVWLDSDTIPLRDLTPLIRSGPSACGLNTNDWNNNVIILGPPNTTVTERLLTTACSLTANQTLYRLRFGPEAITPIYRTWLWNDGLFKHCAVNGCGIGRVPIYFTDGWGWFGPGQHALRPCEPGERWYGAGRPLPSTLRTLFTWHARLGQYGDECLDEGTLISAVVKRVEELLGYGLELGGRDLFPGPVLTSD